MTNIIKESSRGYDCIPIEDELFLKRKIFLTKPVDASTMDSLVKQLLYLSSEEPDKEITIYINSPGGEVQSGLAAYDLLKLIQSPITTVCIGEAASMGAILFLSGDRRVVLPHSSIMIHDPAPGGGDMKGMKPDEMEEKLSGLKKTRDRLCEIIAGTTGKTVKQIMKKTRKDSFFTAEEALEYGLATEMAERI